MRTSTGSIPTRRQFTDHYIDDTGLTYMNARYFDPVLGAFIGCPLGADTIVPDAGNLFSYNRHMYTRGNPLNRIDPSGHVDVSPYLDPGSNCWQWCGVATMNPRPHPMAGEPDLPTREQVHLALDVAGTVDPTGIADGANALIYAAEGDYVNTIISGAALLPLGDAFKAGKYADEAVEIVGKNVDEVVYGEHVLKRMADNPNDLGHNFPTLLDAEILSGTPAVTRANGQQEFLRRGGLNETNGVYHITVGSDGKTVTHRFFIGESDWGRFSTKHGLPDLEDIP